MENPAVSSVIELTREPIDTARLLADAQSPAAGAVLLFLGVTRQFTNGRETAALEYESYETMALAELQRLSTEARSRWKLSACSLVHRLGHAPLGEASVAVVVAAPHREHAFEAGRWLIDTLKEVVPIWKQEHWADGTRQWRHPSQQDATQPPSALPTATPQRGAE